jgi:hypothetical protein
LLDTHASTIALQVDPGLLRLRRKFEGKGTARLERSITLKIRGMPERIAFEDSTEIIMGRTDLMSDDAGHFDLTRFGAHDRGVSRTHALLRFADDKITLTDLNSANGTYLNTKRLLPNDPQPLKDGDEIMLGSLSMSVRFDVP